MASIVEGENGGRLTRPADDAGTTYWAEVQYTHDGAQTVWQRIDASQIKQDTSAHDAVVDKVYAIVVTTDDITATLDAADLALFNTAFPGAIPRRGSGEITGVAVSV